MQVLITPRGRTGVRHFEEEAYQGGCWLPDRGIRIDSMPLVGEKLLVAGSNDELMAYLLDHDNLIDGIEPFHYRDPLFVGDPTFAKAAHNMEVSGVS